MLEGSAKRFFLILLVFAVIYLLFFGEDGILTYVSLKADLKRKAEKIKILEEENSNMKSELERLQNDRDYLEEIVRKKYGLIKEGEKLYRLER
ncbi:MAG: septum formation initiator family protein [Deltaproteobacteria bacterium]|nr:septum formation initiator family protein [Deltaproteobacteria bacterium]